MNISRAQQIVESSKEFLVTYKDIPVWIQNIDENAETARVYTADEPDKEMVIPIRNLEEK